MLREISWSLSDMEWSVGDGLQGVEAAGDVLDNELVSVRYDRLVCTSCSHPQLNAGRVNKKQWY